MLRRDLEGESARSGSAVLLLLRYHDAEGKWSCAEQLSGKPALLAQALCLILGERKENVYDLRKVKKGKD